MKRTTHPTLLRATLVLAFAATACSPRLVHYSTPSRTAPCEAVPFDVVQEGADSVLDYRGDLDAWLTFDPGDEPRVVGYASTEDGPIYTDPDCV